MAEKQAADCNTQHAAAAQDVVVCGSEPCWKIGQRDPNSKKDTGPYNPSTVWGETVLRKTRHSHPFHKPQSFSPATQVHMFLDNSRGDQSARRSGWAGTTTPHTLTCHSLCEVGCVLLRPHKESSGPQCIDVQAHSCEQVHHHRKGSIHRHARICWQKEGTRGR